MARQRRRQTQPPEPTLQKPKSPNPDPKPPHHTPHLDPKSTKILTPPPQSTEPPIATVRAQIDTPTPGLPALIQPDLKDSSPTTENERTVTPVSGIPQTLAPMHFG
ncbi:extensin-like [Lycium ferocissimum]|uniref:extensin-like n=1 Tax=Lycium ferocissimum TaxID=112874 RepID=UPI002814FC7D|nr:extensin-like [Lycium ferocissimum]